MYYIASRYRFRAIVWKVRIIAVAVDFTASYAFTSDKYKIETFHINLLGFSSYLLYTQDLRVALGKMFLHHDVFLFLTHLVLSMISVLNIQCLKSYIQKSAKIVQFYQIARLYNLRRSCRRNIHRRSFPIHDNPK